MIIFTTAGAEITSLFFARSLIFELLGTEEIKNIYRADRERRGTV